MMPADRLGKNGVPLQTTKWHGRALEGKTDDSLILVGSGKGDVGVFFFFYNTYSWRSPRQSLLVLVS